MNIYSLPVSPKFRPKNSPFIYPLHNKGDWGIEQDFYKYLQKHPYLLADDPENADWYFLPIYWTRWHVSHDYARSGLEELQQEIDRSIINDRKTFIVCQYADGPTVDVGNSLQFLGSRKVQNAKDIPLISQDHIIPFIKPRKKYKASFVGRLNTHPIREELHDALKHRKDVRVFDIHNDKKLFEKMMFKSHIALCPRGYGSSSFRFFEAMQMGCVPMLIGDMDVRPFKTFIDWDDISFYTDNVDGVIDILNEVDDSVLLVMGKNAKRVYKSVLRFGLWPKYLIKELQNLGGG